MKPESHYWNWFKQLRRKGYPFVYSLSWAWYNYQRYNLDGTYLKNGKRT